MPSRSIHLLNEPQWLKTPSITTFMPLAWISSTSEAKYSLLLSMLAGVVTRFMYFGAYPLCFSQSCMAWSMSSSMTARCGSMWS